MSRRFFLLLPRSMPRLVIGMNHSLSSNGPGKEWSLRGPAEGAIQNRSCRWVKRLILTALAWVRQKTMCTRFEIPIWVVEDLVNEYENRETVDRRPLGTESTAVGSLFSNLRSAKIRRKAAMTALPLYLSPDLHSGNLFTFVLPVPPPSYFRIVALLPRVRSHLAHSQRSLAPECFDVGRKLLSQIRDGNLPNESSSQS